MPGRLTLVHGFTQTGRSWAPLLPGLAGFDVVTPDLPGHGRRSGQPAGLEEAARLVGEEGGRGTYVGYSMGGRVVLRLALDRPDLVERLVLVSTSAGIEDDDDRAERAGADESRAAALEASGLDAFLEDWLAQPMFSGLSPEAAGLEARRENTAEGLAGALRLLGAGTTEPMWRRLLDLHMPVLIVAGDRDDAYCIQAVHLGGWMGEVAVLAMVSGAGHACHLERPQAFLDLLLGFLRETDAGGGHAHDHGDDHDHGHGHEGHDH
ncbi:MAG: alpha/beta fold hydrolase [Actinomycetota bacterium]